MRAVISMKLQWSFLFKKIISSSNVSASLRAAGGLSHTFLPSVGEILNKQTKEADKRNQSARNEEDTNTNDLPLKVKLVF